MSSKNTDTAIRENDEPGGVARCEVCLTEVPLSVAKSVGGLDYVRHFCGLNCLEKWQAQARSKAKATPEMK